MTEAVIVDIIRTPSGKGKPGGALSGVHPAALLAQTLTALVERSGLDTAQVDDVIAGCVGQIGDQSLNTHSSSTSTPAAASASSDVDRTPSRSRLAAASGRRAYTTRSCPAAASRPTIGRPIRPAPTNPTRKEPIAASCRLLPIIVDYLVI